MNNFEHQQNNPHNIDLRTIDNGRLINPSKAEGLNVHNLKVENITIPVSFTILPSGNFRLNGLQEGVSSGLVMSGFLFNKSAKINHILIDQEIKDYAKNNGNVRIGEAALLDLEKNLKEKGVNISYAVFYTTETIEFFKRNGYEVSSVELIENNTRKHLGIDSNGFNKEIINDETFEQLKMANNQQVLLEKKLLD